MDDNVWQVDYCYHDNGSIFLSAESVIRGLRTFGHDELADQLDNAHMQMQTGMFTLDHSGEV